MSELLGSDGASVTCRCNPPCQTLDAHVARVLTEYHNERKRGVTLERQAFFDSGGRDITPQTGGVKGFLERQLREHEAALAAERERQGVTSNQDLRPANQGAYDAVSRRARELRAQGYAFVDANRIAQQEVDEGVTSAPTQRQLDKDYLGAAVEDLMDANKRVDGHGGGCKSRRRRPTAAPDRQATYDRMLQDDGRQRSSEELRALILLANRQPKTVGAPLKGDEPRMPVTGRMELSDVVAINEATGMKVVAFAERMVPILEQIRNGSDAEALEGIRSLLRSANEELREI